MKKRFPSLALSLLLLFGLTGCGEIHTAALQGVYTRSGPETAQSQSVEEWSTSDASQAPSDASRSGNQADPSQPSGKSDEGNASLDEDGWYSSKEEVALYIHLYGCLPGNYVTKDEAKDAGWTGGSVERYTGEGTAIGGSYFGNYEGLLPKEQGRVYAECDIDTVGQNARGAKRIIFSNDGLIYYTGDHYESFELLYGEP